VSTTIPQRPDEVVLEVQPGEQTAATQVERWLQAYASSRDPRLRAQISWRIWAWPIGWPAATATAAEPPRGTHQTARAGLIAAIAIDRYDPDYGSPFVPYAVACVVRELKCHLRNTS
jgi:hypothetical protein